MQRVSGSHKTVLDIGRVKIIYGLRKKPHQLQHSPSGQRPKQSLEMSQKDEGLDPKQSSGSCIPSFVQVVVGQGFSFPPSSDPPKSSTDAVGEVHLGALCLLYQQKAKLAVIVAGDY